MFADNQKLRKVSQIEFQKIDCFGNEYYAHTDSTRLKKAKGNEIT